MPWPTSITAEKTMKKLNTIVIFALLLTSPKAVAGVVMDMITTDGSGRQVGASKIYAQSEMVRIDNVGGSSSEQMSIIFRGEEMLMLNHKDKTYTVMDEAMLEEMSSQMSTAMQQMEQQLAQMPPAQRAMVEKMMKGKMQGMMPKQNATPRPRVEVGESSTWKSYPCVNYSVYSGGEKSEEICAASLDSIEGSEEIMGAFRKMARFVKKMTESLPGPFGGAMAQNPMNMMEQIDGFPVHTVQFEKGAVSQEISLESVNEQTLDESMFAAPADYKKQDLFKGR